MSREQVMIALEDPSGVAEARHRAAMLAAKLGFDETSAGELAIAVTEAAGNIVKHAERGKLLLRVVDGAMGSGIEALALDQGAGIANIVESLRDGHSTAGSPGTGLGALQRMATGLEIWSQPGKGSMLRFEVWPRGTQATTARFAAGAISVPKLGEDACGDAWTIIAAPRQLLLLVADGLGHGPAAATASRLAVGAAEKHAAQAPAQILDAVHDALRATRGAAAAVAVVYPEKELCIYCGIGNISACVRADGHQRNLVSHNGILGHRITKLQEYQYPFPRNALLVAHSDGLSARWDLGAYPGLEAKHPALIAAALYRDHSRDRDDATVVALRPAPNL